MMRVIYYGKINIEMIVKQNFHGGESIEFTSIIICMVLTG